MCAAVCTLQLWCAHRNVEGAGQGDVAGQSNVSINSVWSYDSSNHCAARNACELPGRDLFGCPLLVCLLRPGVAHERDVTSDCRKSNPQLPGDLQTKQSDRPPTKQ